MGSEQIRRLFVKEWPWIIVIHFRRTLMWSRTRRNATFSPTYNPYLFYFFYFFHYYHKVRPEVWFGGSYSNYSHLLQAGWWRGIHVILRYTSLQHLLTGRQIDTFLWFTKTNISMQRDWSSFQDSTGGGFNVFNKSIFRPGTLILIIVSLGGQKLEISNFLS